MIYTSLTKKALRIAFDTHKEQVDKTGLPYIFHPFHLAEQMETEDEICVALLHDVVEDSDITFNDLRSEGFPDHIIDAIVLLTKEDSPVSVDEHLQLHESSRKNEYMDYIKRIKSNPIATKVKIADLLHNLDESRVDEVTDRLRALWEKYKTALSVLNTGIME